MLLTKISQLVLDDLQNVSKLSRDPSTKCGAVIYDSLHFVGRGCNNPRRQVDELAKHWKMKDSNFNVDEMLKDRNFKINITEHAECAAIRNAHQEGNWIYSSATIFITSTPCLNCAIEIVEAGLKHVAIVGHEPDFNNGSWGSLWATSIKYLDCHEVEVGFYDRFGELVARVENGTIVPCK